MTAELAAQKERLVQTERVAAWRELARRLAHELKNPLAGIEVMAGMIVGFDSDENEVVIVSAQSERRVEKAPKEAIAAAILRRFRLQPEPGWSLRIRQMPTLSPRGGLPMRVGDGTS